MSPMHADERSDRVRRGACVRLRQVDIDAIFARVPCPVSRRNRPALWIIAPHRILPARGAPARALIMLCPCSRACVDEELRPPPVATAERACCDERVEALI